MGPNSNVSSGQQQTASKNCADQGNLIYSKKISNSSKSGFTLVEVMIAVLIIGAGVIPVLTLFMSGSRTVERGGLILEATIAGQNILDRAKSDSFLWAHIPLDIKIPDEKFSQFSLPEFFSKKYQASATLSIDTAVGHTILGTGANDPNLIQITVVIYWVENNFARSTRILTYRARTNSFGLKTATRY
ncbi:MAG: prepilin-type N-terminal cleavage/methylation domain-containing protein [Candidatus Riflebacteria bacterium]|nr:prepilin-type N-terminal cleavage/methylation domain-containing protein [Candidatus Riflebacteria bacterium]